MQGSGAEILQLPRPVTQKAQPQYPELNGY